MFLLDTNVISELRKLARADARVAAWSETQERGSVSLSAVSLWEVQYGMLRIARRDPSQGARLKNWIDEAVIRGFNGRILPVDVEVALQCAALHVPDPKPDRDALIAATALVHRLTLVTRNVADFRQTGVPLLNPWEA